MLIGSPEERQRRLFQTFAQAAVGMSLTDIQGAAVNLILTAVQRRATNLGDAEARWDNLMGQGKQALQRRYRGATDNRDAALETEIAGKLIA